jgi:hypothetical protein
MATGDRLRDNIAAEGYTDAEVADETVANGFKQARRVVRVVGGSGDVSTLYNGTSALVPKFAVIAASSANDNAIVAAVTGKKLRVVAYVLVANAAVNAKWRSGTTDKSGLLYLAANGGAASGYSPVGHFETASGEALNLHLSGAVAVGGHVVYVEV